jgi:hypothetical protein
VNPAYVSQNVAYDVDAVFQGALPPNPLDQSFSSYDSSVLTVQRDGGWTDRGFYVHTRVNAVAGRSASAWVAANATAAYFEAVLSVGAFVLNPNMTTVALPAPPLGGNVAKTMDGLPEWAFWTLMATGASLAVYFFTCIFLSKRKLEERAAAQRRADAVQQRANLARRTVVCVPRNVRETTSAETVNPLCSVTVIVNPVATAAPITQNAPAAPEPTFLQRPASLSVVEEGDEDDDEAETVQDQQPTIVPFRIQHVHRPSIATRQVNAFVDSIKTFAQKFK